MKKRREQEKTRRSVRGKDGLYEKGRVREREGKRERKRGIPRRWEEVILYLP